MKNTIKDISISFFSFTSDTYITGGRTHRGIINFIEIFRDIVKDIKIIRIMPSIELVKYENVSYYQVCRPFFNAKSPFLKFISYLIVQIALFFRLLFLGTDINFFHVGGYLFIIPAILLRLLGRKVIIIIVGESIDKHNLDFHDSNSIKKNKKIVGTIQNFVLLYCSDANVFLSRSLARTYKYMNNTSYFINMNYVEIEKFNKVIPIRERNIDLIFVGGIDKEKGVKQIIDFIHIILKKGKKVKLKIVGDGPLLKDLKNKVNKHGLNSYIKFEGWIDHNKIPKYLNQAKFLILPSITEGLPKVLLEAMACGTIPIATPVGGIPDVIKHGENGFILSIGSAEMMAAQIVKYINHSNLEEISESAINHIKQNYNFEITKEKYNRLIKSLLKN